MQTHFTHIFREGNQVADFLSKMGMKFANLQWWDSFPQQVSNLLGNDYAAQPNYRFKC